MKRFLSFFVIMLMAGLISAYAQETLPFSQSFDDAGWPLGWGVVDPQGAIWSVNASNSAGGTANEMRARWQSGTWTTRVETPVITVTGVSELNVSFKHYWDDYGAGVTGKVQYSTDGSIWTDTGWEIVSGSGSVGPETANIVINVPTKADNIYIAWVTDGDHYQFNYWYIDDVLIQEVAAYAVQLTQITPDGQGEPGSTLYYQLQVENTGGSDDSYTFALSKAWAVGVYADTSDTPLPDPFTVLAGNTADVYLKVNIPSGAASGDYSDDIVQVSGTGVSDSVTVRTTAQGPVTTFPWTETFEDASATRDAWTQIYEDGTGDWTWQTGSNGVITTAHNGTLNARFVSMSGTNSPITKLVSPVLDLSAYSAVQLEFYYGQPEWYGDQNTMEVYYRTSEAGSWTSIWSSTVSVTDWTLVQLSLPNPTATYQIAFEGVNNYGYANVVDDVLVQEAPEYGVDLTQITPDSQGEPGDTIYYQLQVENTGGVDDSYTFALSKAWAEGVYADTSDTPLPDPFTVTAGNTADVYLKVNIPLSAVSFETSADIVQVNGTGVSDSVTVTTMAIAPASLPYTQSFDTADWPAGWTVTDPHGAIWSINDSASAGGAAYEMRARYQSGTYTTMVSTPMFDTAGVTAVNLSFKHFWDDYGAGITGKVQYSTDGSIWTDTGWEIISGSGDVGPETANIVITVPVKADNLYIAWVTDGDHYQYDYWYIDDVTVAEALEYDVSLAKVTQDSMDEPGVTLYYQMLVSNNGTSADSYTFNLSKAWAVGVYADTSDTALPDPFTIAGGGTADVYLKVSIPSGAALGDQGVENVEIVGNGVSDSVVITTTAIDLLFEEHFNTEIPATWTIYEMGDTTDPTVLWHWVDDTAGGGYVRHTWTAVGVWADNWLVSPQVPITAKADGSVWLGFLEMGPNPVEDGFYEYHGVWISEGSGDPNDGEFIELSEILPLGQDAGWQWYSIDLAAYVGKSIYFAFVYTGEDMDAWLIDMATIYNDGYVPPVTYSVSLYANPSDIGVVLTGAGDYEAAETVNIAADLPSKGYEFLEWTGLPEDIALLDDPYSSSASFTMPERNVEFTANYEEVGDYIPAYISIENEMIMGLWKWQYTVSKGSVWQRLVEETIATKMLTGDISGDGLLDIVALFPDSSLWYYDVNANSWGLLLAAETGVIDFTLASTGTGNPDLLVLSNANDGYKISKGINYLEVGVGYQLISTVTADVMSAGDLTNDHVDELIIAFTGVEGMYLYDFAAETTTKIALSSPSQVIRADVTGDGYREAVAVIDGLGVYLIRYIPDKNLVIQMAGKDPFDLVRDIPENSVWVSKNKGGKGLQFNRITWGTPDTGTLISYGDIVSGVGEEVFIVHQNRTYYYNYDSSSWSTLLYASLKRIISGKFTGRTKDDLVVCDTYSYDIYLYHTYTDSWERTLIGGNTNAMTTLE